MRTRHQQHQPQQGTSPSSMEAIYVLAPGMHLSPLPGCPRGSKVSSAEGATKEKPKRRSKRRSERLSAKPPAKAEAKPKKAAAKIYLQTKKVQTKGKRGAKEKQAQVANQKTKDLPAENGETKTEESPASEEAEEKEAKSDLYHIPCLTNGPCLPSCTIQRNIFINYFVNASFLVALETFLRRESSLIPLFKCKCIFLRGEIICWLFIFWYNQKIVWDIELWEALTVSGVSLTFHRWGVTFYVLEYKAY
ncbi:uncharacterized protein LOC111554959 [Piliocolobus tephrosceles]|uniref:uncharacterized protein LOC111554959 n=1 Tax=Piliocolobus tephrosceles TaxID=591936 RepID=UPI000C2A646A|nr:uncharacterized protein LOC111554959 [Piliocolobus tephrosceles]